MKRAFSHSTQSAPNTNWEFSVPQYNNNEQKQEQKKHIYVDSNSWNMKDHGGA